MRIARVARADSPRSDAADAAEAAGMAGWLALALPPFRRCLPCGKSVALFMTPVCAAPAAAAAFCMPQMPLASRRPAGYQ